MKRRLARLNMMRIRSQLEAFYHIVIYAHASTHPHMYLCRYVVVQLTLHAYFRCGNIKLVLLDGSL